MTTYKAQHPTSLIYEKVNGEAPLIALSGAGTCVFSYGTSVAGGTLVTAPTAGSRIALVPAWALFNWGTAGSELVTFFIRWIGVGATDWNYYPLFKHTVVSNVALGSGVLFRDFSSFILGKNLTDPKIMEKGIEVVISGNAATATTVYFGYYQVNLAPYQ